MRVLRCAQGSDEWAKARAGVFTASCLKRMVTPAKLEPSDSMQPYVSEKIAEKIAGRPLDDASTGFMERGTRMEPEAIERWEFENEQTVEKVGFIVRDDGRVGASPDGLVAVPEGEQYTTGIEAKCPGAGKHVQNIRYPEKFITAHRLQCQGGMYVSGLEWWSLISYCPGFPLLALTLQRDEEVQDAIDNAVKVAIRYMDEGLAVVVGHGAQLDPELALWE